jgi:hypothetical protein
VTNVRARHRTRLTPREQAKTFWPWETSWADTRHDGYHRLRDHAEYALTGGDGLSPNKLYQLRLFYGRLARDAAVVSFRPESGWSWVEQTGGDGELIIRLEPEHMVRPITAEFIAVWSRPAAIPDVERSDTNRR